MRRQYEGGAAASVLTSALAASTAAQTIFCNNLTNWPTGSGGRPFNVVIDRGTASEEKILCSSRAGNTLTVYNVGPVNGRGYDGTPVTAHTVNAIVEHVFTAIDADEANAHVNTASGAHGVNGSLVGTTDTQTLTNKTLASPTITSATINTATIGSSTLVNPTINGATFTGDIQGLEIGFSPFLLMGA